MAPTESNTRPAKNKASYNYDRQNIKKLGLLEWKPSPQWG